jgi:hypothetical protein
VNTCCLFCIASAVESWVTHGAEDRGSVNNASGSMSHGLDCKLRCTISVWHVPPGNTGCLVGGIGRHTSSLFIEGKRKRLHSVLSIRRAG